jgi:Cdc6-like AAA superfamily ATPase
MGKESLNRSVHYYQSANLSDDEIKGHFIVRKKEFEKIISEIKGDDMTGSIQHFILIGRRGSGKSTLLRRIEAEVRTDSTLNNHLIPVNLSEEQAGVYRLFDLWSMVINEMKQRGFDVEEPKYQDFKDESEYSEALYMNIQKALKAQNLKIILLLDNIDRIFENIGDDAHLLRGVLMNHKDIRIIGSSTRMGEHYWKYDNPFYEFFRIIRLESLSRPK